jgi:14-3-3 protein epsilon
LGLIRNDLIPRATAGEAKVFYSKMEGDYYRYICEYASGAARDENSQKALQSYQEAFDISSAELSPAHPIRLGLALNFSVFHYEIMQNQEKACEMAK